MAPPPPSYPSDPPGATNHEPPSTPQSGTRPADGTTDNNNKDGPSALPLLLPPDRSAAPLPVRLPEKKGLLIAATGIMLFVFAVTAATAVGTSNRMRNAACEWSVTQRANDECESLSCLETAQQEKKDCGTVPVSYFGGWRKQPIGWGDRIKRRVPDNDPGRYEDPDRYHTERPPRYDTARPPSYNPHRPPPPPEEPETEWYYEEKAAVLVHFWTFALSDFVSALVAIFVLVNIAIFRRAIFYVIALIVLAIGFLAFLAAPIVVTVTTLSAITERSLLVPRTDQDVAPTLKEALGVDCCNPMPESPDLCTDPYVDIPEVAYAVYMCKTYKAWQITAVALMWVFWLISALLRAAYLFVLFQAWKQTNNDGNSVR